MFEILMKRKYLDKHFRTCPALSTDQPFADHCTFETEQECKKHIADLVKRHGNLSEFKIVKFRNVKKKWKKIFLSELLERIDFTYHTAKDENGNSIIRLEDTQGANLGDIGSEEFDNVEHIIDRCEAYWLDYGMDYVEEFADSLGIQWTTWEDIFKDLKTKGLITPNKTYYTQAELQAKGYDTSGIDDPSDDLEVWLLYYLTHPNMVIIPEMKKKTA